MDYTPTDRGTKVEWFCKLEECINDEGEEEE